MNWLKDDAIYLQAGSATELKEGILSMFELVELGFKSTSEKERQCVRELIDYRTHDLMEILVDDAIDGIPKNMQEEIEKLEENMLCVYPGGKAYVKQEQINPKESISIAAAQ